jgi:acetyl esterase
MKAGTAVRPYLTPRDACQIEDVVLGSVRARRYAPGGEPAATVVYLHGGGWVLGDLDDYDAICVHLAVESGCELYSVEYRLAPEHPFPAAVEDAFAALRAAAELAAGRPLVVAGDSAGGNLAAVTALRARDAGAPELSLQVLVYAILDHDLERRSYRANGTPPGYVLTTDDMRWFWGHYLDDPARRGDPLASPLRAEDLSGVAPALVVVAEYDPLHDEGAAYAERLRDAGVRVDLLELPGAVHGLLGMLGVANAAAEAASAIARAVRSAAETAA